MEEKHWKNLMAQSIGIFALCVLMAVWFSGDLFRKPDVTKVKAEAYPDLSAHFAEQATGAAADINETATPVIPSATPKAKILVLDAGHGGNDEGAWDQTGKLVEKDYSLKIVLLLKEKFDQTEGIQVYYTRMEDKQVSKEKRVAMANKLQADALVSIHCNASERGDVVSHGLETLYSTRKTGTSLSNKKLAQTIVDQLAEKTGRRNRGTIRREGLYLMSHSKVPATIVEIGYMSNKSDMKYLDSEKGSQKIADGIYEGIMKALGDLK